MLSRLFTYGAIVGKYSCTKDVSINLTYKAGQRSVLIILTWARDNMNYEPRAGGASGKEANRARRS